MRRILYLLTFILIFSSCNQDYYANTELYIEDTKIKFEEECSIDKNGFAGGDGSASDPFQICRVEHLDSLRDKLSDQNKYLDFFDKYYILTENIDLSTTSNTFLPIGNIVDVQTEPLDCDNDLVFDDFSPNCYPFQGDFDGNGKSILNLQILAESFQTHIGLFQYLGEDAIIHDLNLDGLINLKDYSIYVGGIAAYSLGTIEDINISINILGASGSNVGMISGYQKGNSISNINAYGNIALSGLSSDVGGITGLAEDYVSFQDINSTVSVSGQNYVGGIVGTANDGISFDNVSSLGTINALNDFAGGIVSFTEGLITMDTLSFSGSVLSNGSNLGGIAGWGAEVTASNLSCSGALLTGNDYIGGLFGKTVNLNLDSSDSDCTIISTGDYIGGFIGSNLKDTVITNSQVQLYVAGADRYVGGVVGYNKENLTISNVISTVDLDATAYVAGLVGYSYKELLLEDSIVLGSGISGNNYVAGAVGYARDNTIIDNVNVSSPISGMDHVGGILAYSVNSSLSFLTDVYQSNFSGSISGQNFVGGIIGQAKDGVVVENLTAASNVTCTGFSCGGIVGSITNKLYGTDPETYNAAAGTILNITYSYNVSGKQMVGGILGSGEKNVSISDVIVSSTVSATDGSAGGIVGRIIDGGVVIDSSFTGDVFGGKNNVGGVAGEASATSIRNILGLSNVRVTGVSNLGAITGNASKGTVISQVQANGDIIGSNSPLGGLVGLANNIQMRECSFRGTVMGNISNSVNIGGLIGYDNSDVTKQSDYRNSYVVLVNSSGVNKDPIFGGTSGFNTRTNLYFDTTISGIPSSPYATGLSNANMFIHTNYVGFDFAEFWNLPAPGIYPMLK